MDDFGVDFRRSIPMYFRSVLNQVTVQSSGESLRDTSGHERERAWHAGDNVKTRLARFAHNESLLFALIVFQAYLLFRVNSSRIQIYNPFIYL